MSISWVILVLVIHFQMLLPAAAKQSPHQSVFFPGSRANEGRPTFFCYFLWLAIGAFGRYFFASDFSILRKIKSGSASFMADGGLRQYFRHESHGSDSVKTKLDTLTNSKSDYVLWKCLGLEDIV